MVFVCLVGPVREESSSPKASDQCKLQDEGGPYLVRRGGGICGVSRAIYSPNLPAVCNAAGNTDYKSGQSYAFPCHFILYIILLTNLKKFRAD
jgi:hypothetical protein